MKRWLPFLILNIIVSAGTTLAVLTIWNNLHPSNNFEINAPTAIVQTSAGNAEEVELPPLDEEVIRISNVFAPGDLQNELLVVERVGEGDLNLRDWQIVDEDRNAYVFPAIDLVKGQISLYSRSGTDTVNTLFWGSEEAIWSSGEMVKIYDSAGQERASYEIP